MTSITSKKRLNTYLPLALLFTLSKTCMAELPGIESFESAESIQHYQTDTGSTLKLSNQKHRLGQQSLHWHWQQDGKLSTQHFRHLTKKESPLKYGDHFSSSPTLSLSVYSPKAQSSSLRISYGIDKKEQVNFQLPLNFSGWRTIWVPFHEMQGQTPSKNTPVNYDTFTINATGAGELYLDDIVFSHYQDDRYPYPSLQTQFVQQQRQADGHDHWMPIIRYWDKLQQLSSAQSTPEQRQDLDQVSDKTLDLLLAKNTSKVIKPGKAINPINQQLTKLGIKIDHHDASLLAAPPLAYGFHGHYFDPQQAQNNQVIELHEFGKLLKKIALSHLVADHQERHDLAQLFTTLSRYYLDQGWQAGTSQGTMHHIGYSTRELTEGFFIMRDTLAQQGLLEQVSDSLNWLLNLGKLLADPASFTANIDYLNTRAFYHLLAIMLVEDNDKKAHLLNAFSQYLSVVLAQQDEKGVFKIDGTAWHHGGHYPAYALGAFEKVPSLIYVLANTQFKVNQAGHANFNKAFLASRLYSQKFDIGFGNAGRHPFADSFKGLEKSYQLLALAGSPEQNSQQQIDQVVAQAYLRLWPETDFAKKLTQQGIKAEDISGFYHFPYAATAVKRQDDWAAVIKGYSKYVWASEIYRASNRYGRYPANGTVQLVTEQGELASGFDQHGWDWNRFPGATSIQLPIDLLETPEQLLMFRSNQSFVGSVSQQDNGIFAMQLDESTGFNGDSDEDLSINKGFAGKLRAKKSVFAFDDKLILIGSDISSVDDQHHTQTTLFQSALTPQHQHVQSNQGNIAQLPYQSTVETGKTQTHWLIDPYGNGYHVLSGDTLALSLNNQHSYLNKYSKRTGAMHPRGKGVKETQGEFATAWLDHGKAPTNAGYQYVVYPFLSKQQQHDFGKRVKSDNSYQVLAANSHAHIVRDNTSSTIGYAVFDQHSDIQHGQLLGVSAPSLVMLQKHQQQLNMAVSQPDLNFAKLKPISSYSRPVNLKVTLKGHWQLAKPNSKVTAISHQDQQTLISIECQHGLTQALTLNKVSAAD